MASKLLLITVIHALLFVLDSHCKVYGGIEDDEYNNYGGNHVVPVVNKIVDYYAKPQYAFGYEVDDYYNQLSHGRWEVRDGDVTQGQYRVLLPDGRIQIVSYIADKGGYRPTITYVGKGHHPPPPPAYANVHVPQEVAVAPQPQFVPVPVEQVTPVPYVDQHVTPIAAPPPTPIPVFRVHPSQSPYGHQPPFPYQEEVQGVGAPFKLDVSGQVQPQQPYHHQPQPGPGLVADPGLGSYGDLLVYGPSSHQTVKLAPGKFAKKRALSLGNGGNNGSGGLDRSLFRRDVKKRRVIIRGAKKSPKPTISTTPAAAIVSTRSTPEKTVQEQLIIHQ